MKDNKNNSKKEMTNAPSMPEVCKECYRWESWGHKCVYFWNKKKECGSKVKDREELAFLEQLRRR